MMEATSVVSDPAPKLPNPSTNEKDIDDDDGITKKILQGPSSAEHKNDGNDATAGGVARAASRTAIHEGTLAAKRTALGSMKKMPFKLKSGLKGSRFEKSVRPSRGPRVRHVAKASDATSSGIDLMDVIVESDPGTMTSSDKLVGNKRKKMALVARGSEFLRRTPAICFGVVRGAVPGMVAFETQESVVEKLKDASLELSWRSHGAYFVAGAFSGLAYGFSNIFFDLLTEKTQQYWRRWMLDVSMTSLNPASQKTVKPTTLSPSTNAILRGHIMSYAMLFGTYDMLRVRLLQIAFGPGSQAYIEMNDYTSDAQVSTKHMAAIAGAGGLAGQCQHIIGHVFTGAVGTNIRLSPKVEYGPDAFTVKKFKGANFARKLLPLLPTSKSVAFAFPPGAIGFLAYEYGKILTNGLSKNP
eukprot:CAMPEP_0113310436 /NCGR_PEP_ID=MMETSP0010_2-20120614/8080_1 /TAXON_ID=216773 ORGANISM="Corethron hystrix, Strain 308" /NCGR_SAMPLE_ID=MMETSP0010_2 /ASSEMBLY_ACC=CAM_ASM_000155 /LENGTH=412 /DNA_ID=CAMNT_0000165887 /DNA_START=84 /DNA_END=1322 /DNA_ORIENTATION=- /assembly_acc=CAM_ASM_000155